MKNIFDGSAFANSLQEQFETLLTDSGPFELERIVSFGQATPKGEWYDQHWDEWVVLVRGEAELLYVDGQRRKLVAGDYLFVKAHCRHRVESVSSDAVWLALHLR